MKGVYMRTENNQGRKIETDFRWKQLKAFRYQFLFPQIQWVELNRTIIISQCVIWAIKAPFFSFLSLSPFFFSEMMETCGLHRMKKFNALVWMITILFFFSSRSWNVNGLNGSEALMLKIWNRFSPRQLSFSPEKKAFKIGFGLCSFPPTALSSSVYHHRTYARWERRDTNECYKKCHGWRVCVRLCMLLNENII